MVITRYTLREQVWTEIVGLIVRGEIQVGRSVNEVELARSLGVSRTPVREALTTLESAGFVSRLRTGGFTVLPLSRDEMSQLYPIVAALEGLAIRSADPNALAARVPKLSELAAALVDAADRGDEDAYEIDEQFHDELLSAAGNDELRRVVATLKLRLKRYEFACMSDPAGMQASCREHADIVAALEAGETEKAAQITEHNWRQTMDRLLPLLREQ